MTIEANLNARILELEEALRSMRETCVFNLHSPGNEDDSLNHVVDVVTGVLHDDYEYVPEDYYD